MSEEVALAIGDLAHVDRLRELLNHWQLQAQEAEARAVILQAQLGGWEAQCAAQVEAARAVLDQFESNHPVCAIADPGLMSRLDALQATIETDAGATILKELQAARHLAVEVQRYLRDTTLSPFVLANAVDAYELTRKGNP